MAGVPVWVEDDDYRGCDEIEPEAASLGREQEEVLGRGRRVELVNERGALGLKEEGEG